MSEEEKKGHVLIIEDEELMRELLVSVLERDGYEVSTCVSGKEALEKVGEHFYNVIMIDLEIPGERGMDVIEAMHGMKPDSCIVAITSYQPSVSAVVEALGKGAYDYISKPFTLETLRMIVGRACERQGLMKAAREREHFQRLSTVDELTGLYNYRYFKECLEREVERARRYSFPLSLMMIDADNFKIYNDLNGHVKGNELLKHMAHLFLSATRDSDIIARYGGEEFSVILPHTKGDEAMGLAGRLREIVRKEHFENEEVLPGGKLTISIGIASFPADAPSAENLVNLADRALYRAKYEGKDRVCMAGNDD